VIGVSARLVVKKGENVMIRLQVGQARLRARLLLLGVGALLCGCAAAPRMATSGSWCVLSVEETPGTLAILEPDGHLLARLPIGERPHEVAVSPDGSQAFVSQFGIADYDNRIGAPGDRIVQVDLRQGTTSAAFMLPADVRGPHGIKLRPPEFRELYVNAEVGGDTMLVFDVASHRLLRRFPLPTLTHNFVFSSDGTTIFSFAGNRGATRMAASDGKILSTQDLGSPIRGLFVTANGNVLASAKGEIAELSGSDLSVIRRLPAPRPGQYVYLEQGADGTIAAPSLNDAGIAIFPGDGAPARFVETGDTPIFARFGPDGNLYVSNVEDKHISVLDASGRPVRNLAGLTTPNGLGFGACPHGNSSSGQDGAH
jgi:DNA-binding beta-propeller fold protein YncE